MDETYTREQAQAIQAKLEALENVSYVEFTTKEQAKENYAARVQIARGLVSDDHVGVVHQRPGNGHPLLLTTLGSIRNRQLPYMRRTLGVIFQDFRLIEKKTVWENLEFVMRAVGASPREIRKRIPYVLDLVGISPRSPGRPDIS